MLKLRLLGELEVTLDDQRLALPPSRKTRALLAFLAANGGMHRRERLCSMFWDVPDDPRGALRWSLSRLRAILDGASARPILATRESVGFDTSAIDVDLRVLRDAAAEGFHRLPVERLETLSGLFRGEFLEGLELPHQHEFQSWCAAERENLRRLQIGLLAELIERLNAEPGAALGPARQLMQIDPYNEDARADLLRLLLAAGREQEAQRQFEAAERQFRELGDEAVTRLTWRWRELKLGAGRAARAATPAVEEHIPAARSAPLMSAPAPAALGSGTFVGRGRELRRLTAALDTAARLGEAGITLVVGEPGIGKSRLIAELARTARDRNIRVFAGRAYDGGVGSAYAPWSDALGGLPLPPDDSGVAGSRERLFSQITERILGDKAEPTLVVLDDIHWADEASAELLHHLLRSSRDCPLSVVLGVTEGELYDNPSMHSVLRSLRRDGLVDELRLEPLAGEETRALVQALAPEDQVERLAALSGGNPLFATQLAREIGQDQEALPLSLKELVQGRMDRFPAGAAELLRWASVLGASFPVDRLRLVTGMPLDDVMAALEPLERHSMIRPVAGDEDGGRYCFNHELLRRAVLTTISGPRRKLMHLKVAESLAQSEGKSELALDIAFHAAAGGNAGMAASACAAAARRCLRLFANADAVALVRQGFHYADTLPNPERVERMMELLEIEVAASRSSDSSALISRIEQLAEEAIDHDRPEHARRGYTMLAKLKWEEGDWGDAQRDTLQAELVSRSANERDRVVAMAESARCLTMLERELPRAEALVLEAEALARRLEIEPDAIADAKGMLRAHRGQFDEADALFRRARLVARHNGDRVNEYLALEHLVTLGIERCHLGQCEEGAADLLTLAEKMRDGSELPFARALQAFCRLVRKQAGAANEFEEALEALRRADSKHRLAFICSSAARLLLDRKDHAAAKAFADEALAAATVINRPSDVAVALSILVQVAARTGSPSEQEELRDRLSEVSSAQLSQAVRDQVEEALSPLRASA